MTDNGGPPRQTFPARVRGPTRALLRRLVDGEGCAPTIPSGRRPVGRARASFGLPALFEPTWLGAARVGTLCDDGETPGATVHGRGQEQRPHVSINQQVWPARYIPGRRAAARCFHEGRRKPGSRRTTWDQARPSVITNAIYANTSPSTHKRIPHLVSMEPAGISIHARLRRPLRDPPGIRRGLAVRARLVRTHRLRVEPVASGPVSSAGPSCGPSSRAGRTPIGKAGRATSSPPGSRTACSESRPPDIEVAARSV